MFVCFLIPQIKLKIYLGILWMYLKYNSSFTVKSFAVASYLQIEFLHRVLDLVGIEFILFIIAGVVLCFRSRMKIMLITHWCLLLLTSAYTVRSLSASHTILTSRRLGVCKKLGRNTARTAEPNSPKVYFLPYGIMLVTLERIGQESSGTGRVSVH